MKKELVEKYLRERGQKQFSNDLKFASLFREGMILGDRVYWELDVDIHTIKLQFIQWQGGKIVWKGTGEEPDFPADAVETGDCKLFVELVFHPVDSPDDVYFLRTGKLATIENFKDLEGYTGQGKLEVIPGGNIPTLKLTPLIKGGAELAKMEGVGKKEEEPSPDLEKYKVAGRVINLVGEEIADSFARDYGAARFWDLDISVMKEILAKILKSPGEMPEEKEKVQVPPEIRLWLYEMPAEARAKILGNKDIDDLTKEELEAVKKVWEKSKK